jgi:glycosyltransferase involved in cell wall biosynthesis
VTSVLHVATESFSAFEFIAPMIRQHRARGIDATLACSTSAFPDAGSFAEQILEMGIRLVPIDIPRDVSPSRDLAALLALRALIARDGYELVHTQGSKAGIIGRAAAVLTGTPCVHTVHDFAFVEASGGRRAAYLLAERLAARATKRLLFVSRSELARAEAAGIGSSANRELTGWGVRLDEFDPMRVSEVDRRRVKERYAIHTGAPVVGTVARLVARKGIDVFLQACALATVQQTPTILIAGGGPLESDLRELARSLGIGDRTIFTGFVQDQRDLAPLMSLIDVFALTSSREGYGMVAMEASAMGKPVIASKIEPLDGLIIDGVTGFLCPAGDYDAVALRIAELLADQGLRDRVGGAAQRRAREIADVRPVFERVADVYADVLANV